MLLALTQEQLASQFSMKNVNERTTTSTSSTSSSTSQFEEQRQMRCPELCAVCGDQSTGYHYEVPSCNGCKTFFRRTIVSERQFKCIKDGKCLFTKDIRCACRACRFKKCLAVGMNPKAIQTSRPPFAGQKEGTTSAISSLSPSSTPDQLRKRGYDITSLLDIQPSCSRSNSPNESNKSKQDTAIIEFCSEVEDRLCYLRKSSFQPSSSLLDVLTKPCALDNVSEYEPVPLHFITNEIDFERETNYAIEHTKYYKWFREMNFTDKFAFLCDRIFLVVIFRVSYRRSQLKTEVQDSLNERLRSAIEKIREIEIDRISFSLLISVLLHDCDSFSMSAEAREMMSTEKQKHTAALATYLFAKYKNEGATRLAEHISLLWFILQCSGPLKTYLEKVLPTNSLTKQLVNNPYVV